MSRIWNTVLYIQKQTVSVATTSFATCRTFEGHTGGISCLQFDSNRIVSGSHDKTIKVEDAEHCDVLRFWRSSLLSPACYAKFAVSYSFINWIYFEFLIVLCSRACTFLLRGQISVVSSFTDSHIGLAHPGKISFTLGWNILTWISFPLAPNANTKRGPKGGGGVPTNKSTHQCFVSGSGRYLFVQIGSGS
jgi:WD40 repeat protein